MKPTTEKYVQFISVNHKYFGLGNMNGAECAKELGISQGRVSQIIKEIRGTSEPANQEAQVGPVETAEA